MKQKRILHFVFLGTLVSILSVFVACSNDDDNFSKEPPGSLIVDTAWYGPSQTEFVITTAEALAGLAKLVNDGNDFTGKTIKLGANIMLNDTANWQNWASNPPANEWISIGAYFYDEKIKDYDNKIFKGIFDGNDFIVSGIYINGNLGYYGLFGYVSSGGIIKNLGVYASYIKGDYSVGGLVGNNMGATINNCSFTGTIMAESYAGGLVGQNVAGKINNSFSTGSITGTGSANGSVGGLVGRNADEGDSTISNSYSTSTVIGKSKVGGLVGENDMSIISDSYSTGMVTGEGYVGGLVGWNTFSTINNSYSTSMVTGENSVGGLVGEGGTIYNSYSTGSVTGKNDIGGLVGKGSIIDNSYSTGAVTGEKNVGGLMGFSEWASEISNSYSIGTVTGESNIGGLVGNNYNEWGGIISNSYSIGTVTGENNVGGLVGNNIRIFSSGSVSYGEISNSYYDSQISNQSDTNKGEGKTTAEMKQQSTFVNWDFNDIWDINNTVNNGYPYLVNIMAPQ